MQKHKNGTQKGEPSVVVRPMGVEETWLPDFVVKVIYATHMKSRSQKRDHNYCTPKFGTLP